MLKYFFYKDTIFATIAVFVVLGLLAFVPLNFHILDPFKMAMRDFSFNDLAWSEMGKGKNAGVDKDIVVVNIDDANRTQIAGILTSVLSANPKVVGVDVLFESASNADTDSLLSHIIKPHKNLVLASRLLGEGQLEYKDNYFAKDAPTAFANFVGEEYGVMRHFVPVQQHEQQKLNAFGVEIARMADEGAFKRLADRGNKTEVINYKRYADDFLVVDGKELLNGGDASALKNKIVLLGYVSSQATDITDKHYTPMNNITTGRSIPDMNGVFIHANIVRMILDDDYISRVPIWVNWLLAFLLGWLHMAIFIYFYIHKHIWFHLAAKAAQLILTVFFIYAGLLLFAKADLQINMTPTLAVVLLAVDVLYFYEAFVVWLQTKNRYKSIFYHETHH